MKLLDFIKILRKHIVILIVLPLLLAGLVILLTSDPRFSYTSQTILYTGLATGSSIEMDKAYNYFATNSAFDNLINIVNSRETQEEIAIRLLSQHLLLDRPDPKYISEESFDDLRKMTPPEIYSLVVRKNSPSPDSVSGGSDPMISESGQREYGNNSSFWKLFPASVDADDYELTVRNLANLMKSSDTNFVYKLLNYEDPHYSIKALSTVSAIRIGNSDLVKLVYETDDPGICQQTLALFNEVCIKNFKNIRENRSDDVVKYFETQLALANDKLRSAEDNLLAFNKSNNIINYYEQSKAVAVVKEDMEVDYNNLKAQLAGHEAAIGRLEEKLDIQQLVQLKSNSILDKKKQLGDINYAIANAEADAESNEGSRANLTVLKGQAESLKNDIKKSVDELYSYQNTVDGLPLTKVLSEWINNVVEAESIRAKLMVLDERNREFQRQYSVYAPAGANIKRIEREISVSEQGYLEILHGLNLAKLKLQDSELASNLKEVDSPYYPINPVPTKRKLLVMGAGFLGFLLMLGFILSMEYFDETLKNIKVASAKLNLTALGMFPKVYLKPGVENFNNVQERLIEMIAQNIRQSLSVSTGQSGPKTIVVFSSSEKEGKSVLAGNLVRKFLELGKKAVYVNYSGTTGPVVFNRKFSFFNWLFGYNDLRIDGANAILRDPADYLPENTLINRTLGMSELNADNKSEILAGLDLDANTEYVFIELPALLKNNYPAGLIGTADFSILVCHSGRIWADADRAALENYKNLAGDKLQFIVNGVEVAELESLIGELPKKRSSFRRNMKNLFRLRFHTNPSFG